MIDKAYDLFDNYVAILEEDSYTQKVDFDDNVADIEWDGKNQATYDEFFCPQDS